MTAWRRVRSGPIAWLAYLGLALLSFPTAGALLRGTAGWTYRVDVLDDGGGLPRLGIAVRQWSAHPWTLWDPYLTAGNAFLGQFALPPLSPDVGLAFLIGPFPAFAVSIWVTSVLAAVGMHLFLRDSVGLATPAVVCGSVIALFCYWHPIYGVSVAILPLVLWLGDRGLGPGRHWPNRHAVGLLIAATLALYAGQVQVVCIVAVIQLAWLVVVRDQPRSRLPGWAGTWIAAFALYGPVLAAQLAALPGSERSLWDMAYLIGGTPTEAIGTVVAHYGSILIGFPFARGIELPDPRYGTLFLGGVGLVLAVVGVVAGRRDRAAVLLVCLLVAIPLLDLLAILASPLQNGVPIINSFQFVRIRHFFPFALASVAAIGLDAIVTGRLVRLSRGRRVLLVGVAGAVILVVAGQAVLAARMTAFRLPGLDLSDPRDVRTVLVTGGLIIGAIGGGLLLALLVRSRPAIRPALIVLPLVLLVGDRILLANGVPLYTSNISTYDESLALTPGQSFLLAQPDIERERVLTIGDNVNRMAFQGLLQADGYQAIYPLTYHEFFGTMTGPGLASDPAMYDYFHRWGARAYAFNPRVDPELVALAGIRWLYVRNADQPTIPSLIPRFEVGDVTVFEDPEAFPRAFVVGSVVQVADEPALFDRIAAASLDELRGRAFVTTRDGVPDGLGGQPAAVAGAADITVDTPDLVSIDVRGDRAGLVVLTDVMTPGWTALVDGTAAPIATVDGTFRGVAVSPGHHEVEFRYVPASAALGFAVAGAALASIAVLAIWLRRRRGLSGDRT